MIKFFFFFFTLSSYDNDIEINENILKFFNEIKLFNFRVKLFLFLLNISKTFFEILLLSFFFKRY